MSIAYLHDYAMSEREVYRYYRMQDGTVRTSMLDPADGMCRSALGDLVGCSRTASCAETLLRLIPVYVTDTFDPAALDALAADGIYSVYCQDRTVLYNWDELSMTGLYEGEDMSYAAQLTAAP